MVASLRRVRWMVGGRTALLCRGLLAPSQVPRLSLLVALPLVLRVAHFSPSVAGLVVLLTQALARVSPRGL